MRRRYAFRSGWPRPTCNLLSVHSWRTYVRLRHGLLLQPQFPARFIHCTFIHCTFSLRMAATAHALHRHKTSRPCRIFERYCLTVQLGIAWRRPIRLLSPQTPHHTYSVGDHRLGLLDKCVALPFIILGEPCGGWIGVTLHTCK